MSLQITKQDLIEAAARLAAMGQEKPAAVCADMATKVDRLTDKAKLYANDLIRKSLDANEKKLPPGNGHPKLTSLFFGRSKPLAELVFDDISFIRKNDGTAVWIKYGEHLAGVLDPQSLRLFPSRVPQDDFQRVKELIERIEADPLKAAIEHGRATGRCCVCSRRLTNPASVDAGIGPICSGRLA